MHRMGRPNSEVLQPGYRPQQVKLQRGSLRAGSSLYFLKGAPSRTSHLVYFVDSGQQGIWLGNPH